jgi:hypothetical protein
MQGGQVKLKTVGTHKEQRIICHCQEQKQDPKFEYLLCPRNFTDVIIIGVITGF